MPAPMLLLHGLNLTATRITVRGAGVSVVRTRISANGHYAIVDLNGSGAHPQTIEVRVASTAGATQFAYHLQAPQAASAGFQGFSAKDAMYLIMPDRFADGDTTNDGPDHAAELAKPRGWHGGDLRGILAHLDYLKELGITAVWITPLYDNEGQAQSYHGYGATDVYKVDPHFGTLDDLRALSDGLHQRGMKLVLDMVPNHVGPANPWVQDEPEPDWFHGTLAHHDAAKGEFSPLVDPHAAWRDQKDILEGWFADALPDMNQENPDVSRYLIQNTLWWVEQAGADGIRIDTFPYVGRQFWHDYHAVLHGVFPRLTSVGEAFNPNPIITSAFAGGVTRTDLNGQVDTGLWTPFDFPTYFALRDVLLKGASMQELVKVWGQDSLYPHPERLVPFLGNHDTARFMSMPGATLPQMKLGFAILLTMRGMPQIYSGDEIGMTGGEDPQNRHDFPGGFPGDTQTAFTSQGRTPEQREIHDWVAELLHFRAQEAVFAEGSQQNLAADADSLVYLRANDPQKGCGQGDGERVLVAVNNANHPVRLAIASEGTALSGCRVFTPVLAESAAASMLAGQLTLTLGPKQAAIYKVR
jgi:glycosidase